MIYDFAELLKRHFSGMKRAVEVCIVQDYSFDLSIDEEEKLGKQWKEIVAMAAKRGAEVIQIQLCDTPITDKMRKYIIDVNTSFKSLGEQFRVISKEDFQKISDDWDLTKQFWVVDEKIAVMSNFTKDGKPLSDMEITDERLSKKVIDLSKKTLSLALSAEDFIEKYG